MSARKSFSIITATSETTTRTNTSILVGKRSHQEEEEEERQLQQAQPLQVHTPNGSTSTSTKILEVDSSPPRGPITETTTRTTKTTNTTPQSCSLLEQRQQTSTTTPPSAASPNLGGNTHNTLSNTTQCNTQVIEDTSFYYDDELALQQSNNSLLRTIPWGRITNTSSTATKHWDLMPRPSNDTFPSATATTTTTTTSSTLFMGLHLLTGQIFNEYTLGRSLKVDLPIEPLPPAPSSQQESVSSIITSKVHSMISNRHAKIYCLFLGNHHNMEVYIEDTSGNGTFINSTVKLRKGEKRLLHSGDTICFVNPQLVYGLIHTSTTAATTATTTTNAITSQWKQQLHRDIVQHYSFHYVQLYTATTTTTTINPSTTDMQPPPNRFAPSSPLDTAVPPYTTPMAEKSIFHTTSSKKKKKNNSGEGIVNVKAVHSPSQQQHKHTSASQALLESPKKLTFHGIPTNTATTNDKPNHVDNTSKHYQDKLMVFPLPMKRKLQQQQQQSTSLTFEQQYDLREILGSGTCGQVRRAIHRKTGKVVAVKIIPLKKKMPKKKQTDLLQRQMQPSKSDTTTTTTSNTAEQEAIQEEATLLQSLSHPYIVQMYDLHVDQRYVYIVMELVEGGDLLDRIVSHGCYSERGARQIMRRLLSALVYLHSQRIVHRDLKPENILVPPLLISAVKEGVVCANSSKATTTTTSNTMVIKITDFGLAKQLTEDGLAKTFCGTPQYFAPEVLQRQNTVTAGWYGGPAADCWSLGVILYILLSGYQPFDYSINPNHIITCGSWEIDFSDPVWHPISRSAKDLITRLLCTDATKRMTAKEACTHEWILIQDGDTHTHPLDDPLLATYHHPPNQNQRKEQQNSSHKDMEEQNEQSRNTTVNGFSTSIPADALTKTNNNFAFKAHALDVVTEDHHDGEEDDELLSDFSDDDNVDRIGRNDIVESDRNIIQSKRNTLFWRPDKLKARNLDEHVGEEQNLEH